MDRLLNKLIAIEVSKSIGLSEPAESLEDAKSILFNKIQYIDEYVYSLWCEIDNCPEPEAFADDLKESLIKSIRNIEDDIAKSEKLFGEAQKTKESFKEWRINHSTYVYGPYKPGHDNSKKTINGYLVGHVGDRLREEVFNRKKKISFHKKVLEEKRAELLLLSSSSAEEARQKKLADLYKKVSEEKGKIDELKSSVDFIDKILKTL